jgi:hypothetical protein
LRQTSLPQCLNPVFKDTRLKIISHHGRPYRRHLGECFATELAFLITALGKSLFTIFVSVGERYFLNKLQTPAHGVVRGYLKDYKKQSLWRGHLLKTKTTTRAR